MDEQTPFYKIVAAILIVMLTAGVLTYGYNVFFLADEAAEEVTEEVTGEE